MCERSICVSQKWQKERTTSLGVRPVQCDQHRKSRKKHHIRWPDEDSVALLIDGDHMPAPSIGLFQSLAERLGPLSLQWVYGNWAAGYLKSWQQVLSDHRLEARECGSVTPGKNAADITLTRDMVLLYTEGIRTFVLVASDSDYTPLVSWLCTQGCLVVVIGKATTPRALQQAASTFHRIDHLALPERLVPVYERSRPAQPVVLPQAHCVVPSNATPGEATHLLPEASPAQVKQWVLERLTVYETSPYGWVPVPGFRDTLRKEVQFRPKDHTYKDIMTLLKAYPEAFELRPSPGRDVVHEVRRVQG